MAHDLHHDTPVDSFRIPASTWANVRNVLAGAMLIGWAACLAGYFQNQDQFARSYLVAFLATIFMGLGGGVACVPRMGLCHSLGILKHACNDNENA